MFKEAFSGSYHPEDVRFLVQRNSLPFVPLHKVEHFLSQGQPINSMLLEENPPSTEEMNFFRATVERNGPKVAQDTLALAGMIADEITEQEIVVASLMRAGTPVGILVKRALERLGRNAVHYSISLIREVGLDASALQAITQKHVPSSIIFLDGWTGKGSIANVLKTSLAQLSHLGSFNSKLWTLLDIADIACAPNHRDYLIPSAMCGAICSGLVGRSIWKGGSHQTSELSRLTPHDVSQWYIETIDRLFPAAHKSDLRSTTSKSCNKSYVKELICRYPVDDIERLKPGVNEATRAMVVGRMEELILADSVHPDVQHLIHGAESQNIPISLAPEIFPLLALVRSKRLKL